MSWRCKVPTAASREPTGACSPTEVAALQEQLVSTANSRGSRGFLFSGNLTDTAALSSAGSTRG
jgi:hypothetical protein